MSLTRRLDYRRLLLRPASLAVNPDPLARLSSPRTLDLKTGGSFPRPRVLIPTHSTAGLASRTEPPLQSAPSELYLVGARSRRDRLGTRCAFGQSLGN